MKKIKLFILLIPIIIYSQNYKIKYEYKIPNGNKILYKLSIFDNKSEFTNIKFISNDNDNQININQDNQYFAIKNSLKNELISTEFLGKKRIIIKDSLNIFNWQLIENNKKNILGYNCNKAITTFRGRNYTAYYSSDLVVPEGPWKFQGLPGLILEIFSDDNEYRYIAYEMNQEELINLEIKYDENKFYSWNEFKHIYIKYIDNLINYFKTEDGETGQLNFYKVDKPEIIYEKVQIGSGIQY